MMRGPRSSVTWPKVGLPPTSSTLKNCVWLKVLKNSARNSMILLSVIWVFLMIEVSKLSIPRPRRGFRPKLPKENRGIPLAGSVGPDHVVLLQGVHDIPEGLIQ